METLFEILVLGGILIGIIGLIYASSLNFKGNI